MHTNCKLSLPEVSSEENSKEEGWLSPRPKEKKDSFKFTYKEKKQKHTASKSMEEVALEDIPKLKPSPIVLTSPRKPFPIPEQVEVQKKKFKRRSILFKGGTPAKSHTSTALEPRSKNYQSSLSKSNSNDSFGGFQDKRNTTAKQIARKGRIHSHTADFLLTTEKEGFLNFKEKNSKRWHRRWVALSDTLRCHKDLVSEPLLEIKLDYAAVKKNHEKPTHFEIITSGGTYVFCTENDKGADEWIASITVVCERLVLSSIENNESAEESVSGPVFRCSVTSDTAEVEKQALKDIIALSELKVNSMCADCGAPKPEWASTNLGIFICLHCSGVHRSFGTHISQVRSVRLDKWNPGQVNFMAATGNYKANAIWEYSIPRVFDRITPESSRKQRETWLKLKYIDGRFRKEYKPPEIKLEDNIFKELITPQLMKECAIDRLGNDPEFCKHLYNVIFNSN